MGTRGPTESSDIQQKIVMTAIIEESQKFGMVKQMGVCTEGISIYQTREISSKNIKKRSLTPPSNTWFPSYSKPGGATTRTARGEGGRHRAEGWHVRRGVERPAQQEPYYQRESARVWRTPAPAPAGLHAVSCFLPPPPPRHLHQPRPLLLFLRKSR